MSRPQSHQPHNSNPTSGGSPSRHATTIPSSALAFFATLCDNILYAQSYTLRPERVESLNHPATGLGGTFQNHWHKGPTPFYRATCSRLDGRDRTDDDTVILSPVGITPFATTTIRNDGDFIRVESIFADRDSKVFTPSSTSRSPPSFISISPYDPLRR